MTGFGFGLVSMAMLPFIMDVPKAAAIGTFYGLLVTIATFFRYMRDYNWRRGLIFLISMCVGVPIGVYSLTLGARASQTILLRSLGIVMLAIAVHELFFKKQSKPIHASLSVPFGLFSGGLSGAFNLGGIPTASYAYAHPWTRGEIMAFLQTMLLLSCTLRLLLYKKFGFMNEFSWTFGLAAAIPLFGSMLLGSYAMDRVSTKTMRRVIFGFIGACGVYYVCRG